MRTNLERIKLSFCFTFWCVIWSIETTTKWWSYWVPLSFPHESHSHDSSESEDWSIQGLFKRDWWCIKWSWINFKSHHQSWFKRSCYKIIDLYSNLSKRLFYICFIKLLFRMKKFKMKFRFWQNITQLTIFEFLRQTISMVPTTNA